MLNEQRPKDSGKRRKKLQTEVENLADAIASGALKSSPALASRLAKAEAELAELETVTAPKPAKLIPGIVDEYKAWVRDLETVLSPEGLNKGLVTDRDIARARAQLKSAWGAISS